MNPVDILITNRNSLEAIQLCIESVRFCTDPGNCQIIVYDDCSDNRIDLPYLRCAQGKGWLRLIEGRERVWHGGALNHLLNEISQADLAVLLDCDIEILQSGWLESLVEIVALDKKAIGACDCFPRRLRGPGHWVAPFGAWWFGILNMQAYRDGMMVDWRPRMLHDADEITQEVPSLIGEKVEQYIYDVGCQLLHRLETDNPKGYRIVSPLPAHVRQCFRHHLQVSHHIHCGNPSIEKHVRAKLAGMKSSLISIRAAEKEREGKS